MNKFLKTIFYTGLSSLIVSGICLVSACNNRTSGGDTGETYHTVSFESNGGSAVSSQQVPDGGYATEPDDPTRTDYLFDGWFKESELTNLYEFTENTVTSDITLYAGWSSDSSGSGEKGTATFYWNYDYDANGTLNDAGDVFKLAEFTYGKNISKFDDPVRAGYVFDGWLTADGEEYNRLAKYTEDVTLYARWVINYTFEAEKTQLTNLDYNCDENKVYDTVTEGGLKVGVALSGSANGVALIGESTKASGGKYIAGIDYKGAYIDFEFTSDKAESGVSLNMRLSARFRTLYMSATTASSRVDILVNGKAVTYSDITIERPVNAQDMGGGDCEDYFQNYYIGDIDIKQGDNLIRIYVNNDSSRTDGTVRAYAPVIDCIYLKSTSALTFKEYENK